MDILMHYLTETLNQKRMLAERNYKRISEFEDIRAELEACIQNHRIPDDGVTVEGYSAKEIRKLAPFLNDLGVYNFLISLRVDPEKAKKQIEEGFIIK